MHWLLLWARQPSTIAGASALLGTLSAVALRQLSWPQAVPLIVGSTVSILLPDNSDARQTAQILATDVVTEITSKQGVHHA